MNRRHFLATSAAAAATVGFPAILKAQSKEPLRIGCPLPLTGPFAALAADMQRGAVLAADEVNAKGGVMGRKLKAEVGDDACDPKQARAVAEKLAGMKLPVVIGHFCSSSSIPASEVYNESGVLQITPASTNPQYTENKRWNTFRVCGRDDQQGAVAGAFIAKNYKGKKVALLHDKSTYGKGLADETKKALNKAGIKETLYEAYTAGDKDFTALITKRKQAGVDLIYLGGYHTEAGLIARQAKEQGINATMMSGDALVTDEYWAITGDTGQGTLMTFSPDPRKNPAAAPVVAEFEAAGYDPEGYTLYTYAVVQAWAQAVEKAGSTDVDAVVDALHSNQFDTVLGTVSFDDKGDVKGENYVMYEWDNGKYAQKGS